MPPKVPCICGKRYTWTPARAGRRARCPCGNLIVFPASPPSDEEPNAAVTAGTPGPADPAPPSPPSAPAAPIPPRSTPLAGPTAAPASPPPDPARAERRPAAAAPAPRSGPGAVARGAGATAPPSARVARVSAGGDAASSSGTHAGLATARPAEPAARLAFSWWGALSLLIALALIGVGAYLFGEATAQEAGGEGVHFPGQAAALFNPLYRALGRWGILGAFAGPGVVLLVVAGVALFRRRRS